MRRCAPLARLLALGALASASLACGHSEAEWRSQLDANAQLKASCAKHDARATDALAVERKHVADLEGQLRGAGAEVAQLNASLDDRDRALAEYKARGAQLERIRKRFDLLRKKLDHLTRIGLAVTIRRNRMIISLPGDVLFDSRKDELKEDGVEIVKMVAAVVRSDRSLAERDYQVAGHTDSLPLAPGTPFHDNWGLSLMRARAVLVTLQKENVPKQHWSAAGYADTDPVATNATKDGQQRNRRCDIVVVPDADEMLDLKALSAP